MLFKLNHISQIKIRLQKSNVKKFEVGDRLKNKQNKINYNLDLNQDKKK